MNAYMTITVRMMTAAALAQMRAMQNGLGGLDSSMNKTSRNASSFNRTMGGMNMLRWGSQMQWVGRQMSQNFTLPLIAAGAVASKWALENEKAFVRVAKVYGNIDMATSTVKNELDALRGAFIALSNRFGIAQKDAINIAGDWAAAGASGVGLAKAVELTMKTMVLGEIDAKKATEGLIAIQAQYGQSTDQLISTIEQLNMIENQTGISLNGLIEGFARASGVARSAGVSTLQLGAMLAALTPAAGSAAQAGNALKTIISRLLSPTLEANQILKEMGIHTTDLAWKSATADQRLQILAKSFHNLSDAQKGQVSASIASRYQINKFDVLMNALNNKLSYYYQALRAAENATRNHAQAEKELEKVLESSPQRLQIIWQLFRNTAADVGAKLVPTILMLANSLRLAFGWFNELDPSLRKFLLILGLVLITLGPIIRYMAAMAQALGILRIAAASAGGAFLSMGKTMMAVLLLPFRPFIAGAVAAWGMVTRVWATGFAGLAAMATGFVARLRAIMIAAAAALTGPWGIAIAAIVIAFFLLYDEVKSVIKSIVTYFRTGVEGIGSSGSGLVRIFWQIINGIQRAFFSLPEGVQKSMIAVVNMVRAAAMKVYEFFSYMNPFAHHSPSLVENVTAGMQEVGRQFGLVPPVIAGHLQSAYAEISKFGRLTRTMIDGVNLAELGDKRIDIAKFIPGAVASFDRLIGILKILKADLLTLEGAVSRQQSVVDAWKVKLDAATAAVERQQDAIDLLRDAASAIQDELDAAKSALDKFANAPIEGERAMSDAIFANQMQQKALRLEMMRMEEVVGPLDKLEGKLNQLNGAIELVRGEQESLRMAGAGSEILSQYDAQIAALQAQKDAIDQATAPLNEMKNQLEELQRQAEMMDLEQSLAFDPLRRQVDQLVNSMQELPFEEILAGVTTNKIKVDELEAAYANASAAVKAQEAVLKTLEATRNGINASYDVEAAKLDTITAQYDKVKDAVSAVESALNDAGSAADSMGQRLARSSEYITPGLQNFRDAAGGNFPDPGGVAGIGREGGLGDQSAQIEEFTKKMQEDLDKSLDSLNPFNWVKKKWDDFTAWWRSTVVPWWSGLFEGIDVDDSKFDWIKDAWGWIKDFGKSFEDVAASIGELFRPELERIIDVGKKLWDEVLKELGPEFSRLGQDLKDLKPGFDVTINVLKIFGAVVGAILLFVVKGILPAVINGFHALLSGVISVIKGIIQIVRGFVMFISGMVTGDYKRAWEGLTDIVKGVWNVIVGIFKGVVGTIWGIVRGLVDGVVGFFQWLYDVLVGHSIIPDLIRDIVAWMKSLPGKVMSAINGLITLMSTWARNAWNGAWNIMKTVWNTVWGWLKTVVPNAMSALSSFGSKMADLGKNAFNSLHTSITNLWNNTVLPFLKSIPGRAASAMSGIGSAVANAVKGAWNGAANFLNTKVIDNVNKVTGKFGVTIPKLPMFAKGGVIPGAVSKKDNVLIGARTGEGIVVPEVVKKLGGERGIAALNNWGRNGRSAEGFHGESPLNGLQHFQGGGVVGSLANALGVDDWLAKGAGWALDKLLTPVPNMLKKVMPNGWMEDYTVGISKEWKRGAKTWGDKQAMLGGGTPGSGKWSTRTSGWPGYNGNQPPWSGNTSAAAARLRSVFPGQSTGSYVSGFGWSDHYPKAIDAMTNAHTKKGLERGNAMVNYLQAHAGEFGLKDMIWNGKYSSGKGWSRYSTPGQGDHSDHVHSGYYDKGGPLHPGYTMAYNGTGKTEWTSTADQMLTMAGGLTRGVHAARGLNAVDMLLARMESRIARTEESMTGSSNSGTTVNIYGDLVLPNITSGSDAEEFVKNLEALARA